MQEIAGYHIEEQLYDSTNSLVYRGHRLLDDRAVILKVLKDSYPSPERVAWFKREYEMTRAVALDGVPQIYGLEMNQHHWIMVQEDFGGDSLRRLSLAGHCRVTDFLKLAIQMADILGQIHQQQVMHKDINPANMVLNLSTYQLKFIDFGIATRLSRENPTFRNPSVLEGTLAYMSPEQAGRMNRAIDYRTDFYSLGVTFYELLTGQVPFISDDPLELVHSHIARHPIPPHELKPTIPPALSAILLKLMAKNAEDRYQSAYGLKADLEACLQQMQQTGTIDSSFAIGQKDISDRFQIPQKLYGREPEIKMLLATFERVSQGASDMMLVTGAAGIGKSALVQEIYKPVTRQRGYFIAGKFDQFQRNIPYSAFIQAFRSLMRHLLTESEAEIAAWRQKILAAVGNNGQVLIDVIPEVELIIGQQPEVLLLGPAEAQRRLNLAFQNFITVFTQPEHPLVIFLDDLQWADGASLKLMEALMTTTEQHYLLLIGAYRENEIRPGHPLQMIIEAMRQASATIHTLSLSPLDGGAVKQLIADTMRCKSAEAKRLAELVVAKTGGNPFFLNEFLKSLYVTGIVHFNHTRGKWSCNLDHTQLQDMTDNVVELMAEKVQQLPHETQRVLKLAACIGNQFDLETLALVNEHPPRETARQLGEAITDGLILPLSDACKLVDLDIEGLTDTIRAEYTFTHDRIQQAAYSLIPLNERHTLHWRIGQLLLQQAISRIQATHGDQTSPDLSRLEDCIFAIVNQLNQGIAAVRGTNGYAAHGVPDDTPSAVLHQPSIEEVAELNLRAGRKALASVAYEPALNYLRVGVELLEDYGWYACYDLMLALATDYARCCYLNGQIAESEQMFDLVVRKAASNLDKADVYNTRMLLYTSMGQLKGVIETGLEGLRLLGLPIALVPDQEEIDEEIAQVHMLLAGKDILKLRNLPLATDPQHCAAMRLLMNILITAWWRTNMRLLYLVTLKMVHRSLQHGTVDESSVGYAWYGVMLGSGLGDYKTGHAFGELALRLNDDLQNTHLTSMVNLIFGAFIHFWRFPLDKSLHYLQTGYQVGVEVGDLLWAGINSYAAIYTMLIKGDPLDDVYQEIQQSLEFAKNTRQIIPINMLTLSQQFILSLKGYTSAPGLFSDDNYNEERHITEIKESEAFRPIFWYYKIKLHACYLFENYAEAHEIAQKLDALIEEGAAFGNVTRPEHYFYYSLTLAALYPAFEASCQADYWDVLTRNQIRLKRWADNCPQNFRHKYLLVAAEVARLREQLQAAHFLYEQAISSANENASLPNEALAHELFARFALSLHNESLARQHLLDARNGYLRWGADAKVHALDATYPHLFKEIAKTSALVNNKHLPAAHTSSSSTTSSGLDISTVIKAAQAISGEMVLDTLLARLMHSVMENAGAERGLLLLKHEEKWVIEAEGDVNRKEIIVVQSQPLDTNAHRPWLPLSILNYVSRTHESVVLNDATHEGPFVHDRYILTQQPLSLLCAPLIKRGSLMGILYLENNLTTDAFTPDRLEVLNLLAAQAAISIKNAMLYTNLEQSEEKYRNLFENSRDTIFITASDGKFLDINMAGLRLFGYSREELQRLSAVDLYVNKEDRNLFRQSIVRHGSVRDYPLKLRRKDGVEIDCLLTASVRYAEDGTLAGYQGIIRDITEQKRAEAERVALLDQQARRAAELHAIIQSMADGLLVVDAAENVMIVNPVAATILERQASELVGQPLSSLSNDDDPVMATGLQHIVDQIREEMRDPDRILPEERISLGKRIVRLQSAPTLVGGKTITGAVMVMQDVTEAVEAERTKNVFIATASHEMRTPLASMKGFVDIFYMSGIDNLTENQLLFLDTIKRQTESLVQMVNDLLEVARLDQGSSAAEHRWLSIEVALTECLEHLKTQINARQIHLTLDIVEGLPSIWIDALHMRRILTNLISNAVKYVYQGGGIHVRAYELHDPALLPSPPGDQPWKSSQERSVVIEVEDDGVGIREADQARIFTRFFRSDNQLSVEAGGTGLGLAITKSLVHLHRGQIGFRSVEQEGTTFWVRFPAPITESLHDEEKKRGEAEI